MLLPLPIDRLRNSLAKQVSRIMGCLEHIPQRYDHRASYSGAWVSQILQRTRQRPSQPPLCYTLDHPVEPAPVHGVYPELLIDQFLPVLCHHGWC